MQLAGEALSLDTQHHAVERRYLLWALAPNLGTQGAGSWWALSLTVCLLFNYSLSGSAKDRSYNQLSLHSSDNDFFYLERNDAFPLLSAIYREMSACSSNFFPSALFSQCETGLLSPPLLPICHVLEAEQRTLCAALGLSGPGSQSIKA